MKVLNTRATHQAKKLTSLLESSNIDVVEFPLLVIKPIAFSPIKTDDFDIVIFTSQNAATHFYAQQPDAIFLHTVIAIGPATQAVLEKNNVNVMTSEQFDSEGVLALDILHDISGKKIAIICGKNPKLLLRDELIKRGAITNTIFSYQRIPIDYDMSTELSRLSAENIDVIVVTSNENYQRLLTLCEASIYRDWLLSKTLCVNSETLKQVALADGFKTVLQSNNATDEAIVKTLYNDQLVSEHISNTVETAPMTDKPASKQASTVIAAIAILIAISAIFMTTVLLKKINELQAQVALQASLPVKIAAPHPADVNSADVDAIFSRIADVNRSIQQLSEVPKTQSILMQAPKQTVDIDLPWYKRFLHSFMSLKNLFLVRRIDADSAPLITPKEASLAKQNISAQLTIAQLALLKHDTMIYQSSLKTASAWLIQYFSFSDAIQPILHNLTELQKENLQASSPLNLQKATQPTTEMPKQTPKKPVIGVET